MEETKTTSLLLLDAHWTVGQFADPATEEPITNNLPVLQVAAAQFDGQTPIGDITPELFNLAIPQGLLEAIITDLADAMIAETLLRQVSFEEEI